MTELTFLQRLLALFGIEPTRPLPPPPEPRPPSSGEPAQDSGFNFDDERVPKPSRKRVEAIRALLNDLEARAMERQLVGELTELRRIRDTHLPRMLRSYIEIPVEHRAEVFRETGRSAVYLLNERLDRMIARLQEISKMLARGNLNAFAENMRFIDLRYGSPDSPFD